MSTAPADPMIDRLIDGRYQVRSRIARGGMATVYLATDLRLERRVAIKIMHGHLADDNTFKTRFVQEARSAARLAHPNVVNVFDQGQDADMAYLVMEYLPGITLRELLKDYKKLTPEQTVDIMDAVLSGLAAAHKAGIVHRDLKPENVLLADDGRIKLGDFGLARAASANTATGQALLGTIAYLSPELVTRGVADARSDIYAVGIMMYEMLTGEQPYVGEAPMQIAYQHANDEVPAPSLRNPAVPASLDELVLWATRRDPEERPRDARELLDRLRAAEPELRASHLPITTQATMVLPAGMGAAGVATAETSVLGGTPVATVAPQSPSAEALDDDDTAALTAAASRRKRRGYWILALVLVLAGLAGGTGWYFGAGPGAYAEVPPVSASMSPDEAATVLEEAGFVVDPATRTDPEIPKGQVAGTDPAGGQSARRGSTVTLYVSEGPQMLDVPEVVGKPEAEANDLLAAFTVGDPVQQFSADVDSGSVIAALDGEGRPLSSPYPERGTVTLVVSVGPVPPVEGTPADEAQAKLEAAHLEVKVKDPVFSDTVPKGIVITADWMDDPMRPGSVVELTVSKGQDLVAVPDVVGKNWTEAKQLLTDAGFALDYNLFVDIAPDTFVVSKVTPEAGQTAKRGSTVTVNFQGF
ncbi:Stk1 family PASTA domain-containing Ser/Thr kinase [Agromyces endophyticus]|uniref:Stk1 family PASTA domain-containing Ser/Thr kinase n=1 Tax=Agromyces sp. H17E-10 TaxID=2932244 RepID=UPI001FD4A787|nr:Stk1 family PASTA domain-containing Ser/Thr kinase [Agromyces sp. H17E-10]UOQ89433.1 Stk1 family PASTA domain-containing Ser/Thr kinase [Agromyces sp. H17E-10]